VQTGINSIVGKSVSGVVVKKGIDPNSQLFEIFSDGASLIPQRENRIWKRSFDFLEWRPQYV